MRTCPLSKRQFALYSGDAKKKSLTTVSHIILLLNEEHNCSNIKYFKEMPRSLTHDLIF